MCNHVQSLQLEPARLVGSFVRLSSSSLLTSQTVPRSTLQLLIIFVPFCAIRVIPQTQSTGSHVGLQNVVSHWYLLERYENHGIPNCRDDMRQCQTSITQYLAPQHSAVMDFECRENKITKNTGMCREEAMREGNRSHGYPCVSLFLFCNDCVEKEQC